MYHEVFVGFWKSHCNGGRLEPQQIRLAKEEFGENLIPSHLWGRGIWKLDSPIPAKGSPWWNQNMRGKGYLPWLQIVPESRWIDRKMLIFNPSGPSDLRHEWFTKEVPMGMASLKSYPKNSSSQIMWPLSQGQISRCPQGAHGKLFMFNAHVKKTHI